MVSLNGRKEGRPLAVDRDDGGKHRSRKSTMTSVEAKQHGQEKRNTPGPDRTEEPVFETVFDLLRTKACAHELYVRGCHLRSRKVPAERLRHNSQANLSEFSDGFLLLTTRAGNQTITMLITRGTGAAISNTQKTSQYAT